MVYLKIYDRHNIDELQWNVFSNGEYAQAYLSDLIRNGVQAYISNVDTEMMVLAVDDILIPITINNTEYDNSYVCSPYTHYVSCGIEETQLMENRFLRFFLKVIFIALSGLLKWGQVNKVVSVNNWLLPTNLYPPITSEQISSISEFLKNRFPHHAIQFRSLNSRTNDIQLKALIANHYHDIMSRQIFFLDAKLSHPFKANMFKKDLQLLQRSPYTVVELPHKGQNQTKRLSDLYREIYLKKYTMHNPQYSEKFIDLAIEKKLLTMKALIHNGKIDGVYGYVKMNDVMTMPFFGYDTSLPTETGLYRKISALLALDAKEQGLMMNLSAGASSFKRLRRAEPHLEYNAVYLKHLSLRRQIAWLVLKGIVNPFGKRILKKLRL